MSPSRSVLLEAAKQVSPAHRRWRRLLASLSLDPDTLQTPLPAPGPRDVLVCGSPRSGTALLAAMLHQPPRSVAVMEPWDAFRLPPADLCASLRHEVDTTGVLGRGRLDIGALEADGAVTWCRDGERPAAVRVAGDWTLAVKLPAFWRYLDLVPGARFLVCLRHPYEVVASYRATGGRLAQGLEYDVPFHRRMNAQLLAATPDAAVRRVLLHDYVASRLLPHLERPDVHVVRYERWFTDPAGQLADIGRFLRTDLSTPLPRVRPPRGSAATPDDEGERALVRRCCTTAEALGYRLDAPA